MDIKNELRILLWPVLRFQHAAFVRSRCLEGEEAIGRKRHLCLLGLDLYVATAAFYWMSKECKQRLRETRRDDRDVQQEKRMEETLPDCSCRLARCYLCIKDSIEFQS